MKSEPETPARQSVPAEPFLPAANLFEPRCPSRVVLKHVTSRWGMLVLIALRPGTLRFSELRRRVGGVSEKMLAQTLQWLEADGFVRRTAFPVVPPHVEYTLTPLGHDVGVHVQGLAHWIEDNLGTVMSANALRGIEPPNEDGEEA